MVQLGLSKFNECVICISFDSGEQLSWLFCTSKRNLSFWRLNERYGLSNHRYHDCLLDRFFSGAQNRKYQISASLAHVRGIHWWPVDSPHKGPVTREILPFDNVIMAAVKWQKWVGTFSLIPVIANSSTCSIDSCRTIMYIACVQYFHMRINFILKSVSSFERVLMDIHTDCCPYTTL